MINAKLLSRKISCDVLHRILELHENIDQALAQHHEWRNLEKRDRSFTHHLLLTCLRHLGHIDYILAHYVKRPFKKKDLKLKNILRLALTQLLWLEIPAYAVISTMVELAGVELAGSDDLSKKSSSKNHLSLLASKKFINAILRRITQEDFKVLKNIPCHFNVPIWLWQSLKQHYGENTAKAIIEIQEIIPPLDLNIHPTLNLKDMAEKLDGIILPTNNIRKINYKGMIKDLPDYQEGSWWVQDSAATLPALLLEPVKDKEVLDLCAAPGGKTMQLISLGAKVTAVDHSEQRLVKLKENLARLKFSADVICADILNWTPHKLYSHILLDAPCSATGTLRRNPDIMWLRQLRDVEFMATQQVKFLNAAYDMLDHGGILVFSTCSLNKEEGEYHLDRLLAESNKRWNFIPIKAEEIYGLDYCLTSRGELRTLPCYWKEQGGMDGFYAMRLQKL
ncbi:MAG: MFS transporter [Alphaproteobacteria bacterium]|nr:MFS transporter [Alphaproteobacteria bacterium]